MNTGFKFLKEAGAAISDFISGDGKVEDAIKNRIQQLNLDIDNLKVAVDDEKATISGTTNSQDDREKAILAAGNVKGIEEVIANIQVNESKQQTSGSTAANQSNIQVASSAGYQPTFYQVQSGDTLSLIAKKFYGNSSDYQKIFKANQPMLSDPDKIYPGQTLRIPGAAQHANAA